MSRDDEAIAILRENDRGTFSVPTKGLYPFQWNWDSAFASLGYAHLDPARAVRELKTLAAAQWTDGMIPHIIFHSNDDGYFPGPDVWGSGHAVPTSGITQPPVLAIAAERLLARGALGGADLAGLVEAIDRWHRWFQIARRDPDTGAIAVIHPWESGRDNLPDWDGPLEAVDASNVAPFQRRDLGHVDAAMRPTKEQYERYIALVEFGRSVAWNQAAMPEKSPFFVADPGMTAILARAETALATLAEAAGRLDLAAKANERAQALRAGMDRLWSDEVAAYTTRDVRTGKRGTAVSAASFLGFLAGGLPPERAAALNAHFDRMAEACRYMCPSWDPAAPDFDEKRYWRGPVWLVVNWLIAMGLAERGDAARAERVRADSAALVKNGGFYEYYSPLDGAPLGGGSFTWTAAAWLDFAKGAGDGTH
ncbi:trehalase family glycosidase [Acuticoccus sp. MNP-M23]|uniref:MGH1-like glycoside hydrolase domain-containing protein n=1 Tax=Acuticoccus sp. MNP-M23 TaxID=3072793 RepID=UPI0028150A23|nr:trehalase family glycosidase [Acuticoccus sp. MNP-M23]WMS44959.1 trehalase family glycosidase [Acuticoccus sp. MNP-M23]